MNRYFRLVFYILISSVFVMGCRQGEDGKGNNETHDPELVLKSLVFNKEDLDISNLKDIKATVPNNKATVETKDVEATFNIADVKVNVKGEPVALEEGKETDVTIFVDAVKGKHKAYSQVIKVTRENANNPQPEDPTPVLQSMKIHEVPVVSGKVTVTNDKATVETKNVEATFNIADVKVTVKNEPVALKEGEETDVTITVPAVKGKYKAIADIVVKVTRESANNPQPEDPTPVLQSMKIHGVPVVSGKVTVTNDKATVETKNVEATFNIADVKVTVKNEPVALKEGEEVDVTISVPAVKGKYKAIADIVVKVTREEKDDPLPVLQSMKIHGVQVVSGKVTVPNDKATVETKNVEAVFDIADVTVSVKNEPVALEAGKETLITIEVPAVKGKHKALDIEVRVTREEKQDVKLKIDSIYMKEGEDDWGGGYDYKLYIPLKYQDATKYWEGKEPDNADEKVLAFKLKLNKADVDENKITARLFQGTPKGPTVVYETEKTNAPIKGKLDDGLLVFEFDHTNCKQISVKTYYKIEIFIDGISQISAYIKIK